MIMFLAIWGINIFEFYVLYRFCQMYLKPQIKHHIGVIYIVGFLFALLLAQVNLVREPTMNGIVALIMAIGAAYFLFRDNLVKTISYIIVFFTLSFSAEMLYLTIYIVITSTNMDIHLNQDLSYILNGIIGKAILFVLFQLMKSKFKPSTADNNKHLLILTVFPVFAVLWMFIYDAICSEVVLGFWLNLAMFLFIVIVMLSSIVTFFIYSSTMDNLQLEKRLEIKQNTLKFNELLFSQQQNYIDEMAALKHDYKNHISNIMLLLNQSNDAARQYCVEFTDSMDSIEWSNTVDFRNLVLSSILASITLHCREKGIQFDVDIRYKDFSFLNSIDTSIIFDNIFNNAIEASDTVICGNRKISFIIDQKQNFIVIILKNNKDNIIRTQKKDLLSTKRNYLSTGQGLKNTKKVAEKYGGYLTWEHDDSSFTVKIRLNPTMGQG